MCGRKVDAFAVRTGGPFDLGYFWYRTSLGETRNCRLMSRCSLGLFRWRLKWELFAPFTHNKTRATITVTRLGPSVI